MRTKPVTYRMANDLLTAWGDRRLPPINEAGPIDFTLEAQCDDLCTWLADDPERDLSMVPAALLRHLRARIAFAIGVCLLQPLEVIGEVPTDTPDDLTLAVILGTQVAGTRFPPEWRLQ